ncbi:YmfQ family protein [Paraburkholderia sp. BR14320]|uniref:YmfQ family protein n=1 Tax=unclassified Paraburkholderia TaxID=2615204 RepID=UPI0034CD1475
MSAPNYQAADFLSALQALMPRGLAWPRDPSAVMTRVMGCLTPTFARHAQRNNALLVDAFPATAVELLPEWESALGLPDPCAGPAPNLQSRQRQVVARFAGAGGQSIAYYISYAATLGYAITVTEFTPFRVGQQAMGAPLGTQDWAFTWQVNAPLLTLVYFRAGESSADEPLETFGNAVLSCELEAIKPAHTILNMAYH